MKNPGFRYLRHDDDLGWTGFGAYFDYLAGIRERLGEALYAFAADFDRYGLHARGSLHDAWLQRLTLAPADVRAKPPRMVLELDLLGPWHDRVLRLRYDAVSAYSLVQPPREHEAAQDLLCHELRLDAAGECLEHFLQFDDGFSILVACRSMRFEEIMLEPPAQE